MLSNPSSTYTQLNRLDNSNISQNCVSRKVQVARSNIMMEVEKLCLKEPQWILDRQDSGPLFWRRDSSETARVKFRYDVDVKEFQRSEHEFEEQSWPEPGSNLISTSMSVMFCITVTVILPWLLFVEKSF